MIDVKLGQFDSLFNYRLFPADGVNNEDQGVNFHGIQLGNDTELMDAVDAYLSSEIINNHGQNIRETGLFRRIISFRDYDSLNRIPKVKAYMDKYNLTAEDFYHKVEGTFLTSSYGGYAYRSPHNGIAKVFEKFTYYDTVTPLRAYRVGAENAILEHVYKEVELKSTVTTNYYLDNTTTSLADSEVQNDLAIGSRYTTYTKEIPIKVEDTTVDGKLVRKITRYELIRMPENASGDVSKDPTVVNYYYKAVTRNELPATSGSPHILYPILSSAFIGISTMLSKFKKKT